MQDWRILPAGDACLMLEFASVVDPALSGRCAAIARTLRAAGAPGLRDVVPAYNTVAMRFDPLEVPHERAVALLEDAARHVVAAAAVRSRVIEVPVIYGGEAGPDLATVARFASCTQADVVRLHADRVYHVYMLGFLPGFAYMGPVDDRIAAPRLATPRARVPAGSVGIAGRQTGVYPIASPGGWQIIGRTSLRLFDPAAEHPFLFAPGDRVKFVPVSAV